MSADAKKTDAPKAPVTPLEKARAARKAKVMSAKRKAAEDALSNAKSDQEKTAARAHVKIVRFEELTAPRVRRALKALSNVEALTNRGAYTYTEEQAAKVVKALKKAVDSIETKFGGAKAAAEEFAL
jgi:hypothetical protein